MTAKPPAARTHSAQVAIALVTTVPAIVTGALVNLGTALVPTSWVYSWRWPLAILLAAVVATPALLAARRKWPDEERTASITGLASASDAAPKLDLFVVADHHLFHASYRPGQSWSRWEDLNVGKDVVDVAAVSPAGNRLECYAVDVSGALWSRRREQGQWSSRWQRIPIQSQDGRIRRVAAMSGWPGHRELYVVTETGQVLHC
jgi:hypothetical protein